MRVLRSEVAGDLAVFRAQSLAVVIPVDGHGYGIRGERTKVGVLENIGCHDKAATIGRDERGARSGCLRLPDKDVGIAGVAGQSKSAPPWLTKKLAMGKVLLQIFEKES